MFPFQVNRGKFAFASQKNSRGYSPRILERQVRLFKLCSPERRVVLSLFAMEGKDQSMKKQRKANWSNNEIWLLLEEVRLEKACLMTSLTNDITNKKKTAIWQRIADKLSASCGVEHRSVVSVREKWGALKSEAQRRRDRRKATGGGAVKDCEYDNAVFDILGEGTNLTDGIDDGRDMFNLKTITNCSDMPSTPPMTVTSDSITCDQNDQLSVRDSPSTSTATENSVELVEDKVAASSQGKPSKESNIGKKLQNRTKLVPTNTALGSPLGEEYLKSEIDKNKHKIELQKFAIEFYKSNIELNKLRMEVLRKQLATPREEYESNIDVFDHVTYV